MNDRNFSDDYHSKLFVSFRFKKKNLLLHFYKGHLQKNPVLVLFQNMEKSSVICKTVKDLSGMLKSIYIHLCYPKHAGFFGLRAWALAFGILVSRMKNFRLPNLQVCQNGIVFQSLMNRYNTVDSIIFSLLQYTYYIS